MSKHEKVIKYIYSLKAGTKISVRRIANALNISDGTAYKAIRECAAKGFVTTIPRIGTVRIQKLENKKEDVLTFAEIINTVDGNIVAGKNGTHKTIHKFVIGAMTLDAIEKYLTPGCLLIAGNREEVHRLALLNDCGIIITGGFKCSDEVKKLANQKSLPIIYSMHDTFTVGRMINKALSESLARKDVIFVKDIMKTNLEDYDIDKIIDKNTISFEPKTTAAYASYIMCWRDISMCPVIRNKKVIGVVTKEDIVNSIKYTNKPTAVSRNIEKLLLNRFKFEYINDNIHLFGKIGAEMLECDGTATWSSMNMLLSTVGIMCLKNCNNVNIAVDSIYTSFIKPVQIDTNIDIYTELFHAGKNADKYMEKSYYKIEVVMYNDKKELVAKSFLSAKVFRN